MLDSFPGDFTGAISLAKDGLESKPVPLDRTDVAKTGKEEEAGRNMGGRKMSEMGFHFSARALMLPEVAVDRETGTWRTFGCFGEEGQHHGAPYDMAAVVNPSLPLREGMVLSGWPRCQAMSPVILVTRQ